MPAEAILSIGVFIGVFIGAFIVLLYIVADPTSSVRNEVFLQERAYVNSQEPTNIKNFLSLH